MSLREQIKAKGAPKSFACECDGLALHFRKLSVDGVGRVMKLQEAHGEKDPVVMTTILALALVGEDGSPLYSTVEEGQAELGAMEPEFIGRLLTAMNEVASPIGDTESGDLIGDAVKN